MANYDGFCMRIKDLSNYEFIKYEEYKVISISIIWM